MAASSDAVAGASRVGGNDRRFFLRRNIRQSSFILPRTGERVKHAFTLRDPSISGTDGATNETSPLLGNGRWHTTSPPSSQKLFLDSCKRLASDFWTFATSKTGQGILKCSLAYLLASLAIFVPLVAGLIGKQDSKHVVATVTVYFHPARTRGSMHEATIFACIAFCYAAFISFTSMAVSMFFGQHDLIVVGHAIVLVVFIGGGLGFVGWLKQSFGNPLVNVSCSLTSLAIITVLCKEGSVQAARFSDDKVWQVLLMVIMGITATTLVNILILPISARSELCNDLSSNTDLLGDRLIGITRAFLSGQEDELQSQPFKDLSEKHQKSLNSLKKNLSEAGSEHYVYGTERQYSIERRLVQCLQKLSQDVGGLRSAASSQFSLIGQASNGGGTTPVYDSLLSSPTMSPINETWRHGMLEAITEAPDESENVSATGTNGPTTPKAGRQTPIPPSDMFGTFIQELGPPTKSLTYTLKQILDELPFAPGTNHQVMINEHFRTSLESAILLYQDARKNALRTLWRNRELTSSRSVEGLADVEEVSASCGHFSFSLLDFAEDVLRYLDVLEELKTETEYSPKRRSWHWLQFWRKRAPSEIDSETLKPSVYLEESEEHGLSKHIPSPVQRADAFTDQEKGVRPRSSTYGLYRAFRIFRRDDTRFAIKVGVGAALFALPAFLASTRPIFSHWRGEWGLVSYMVVCSMTVGASNTTGIRRFIGTGIGAACAILAWIIADDSPWVLGFLGWLIAAGCFYIILARNDGPMGRFILLTYNISALYAYSLSVRDDDDDDDEGGINPVIWEIVTHRVVAVIAGCIWAIIITRLIWPISARRKLKDGTSVLWLRMSLIWKRDPLALFLVGEPQSSYMDIREEAQLQLFLAYLDTLRKSAASEFELRGPFPDEIVARILERTQRMLDAFHAMNVVISKNLQCTPGEAAVLRFTRPERFALSARISHLFSVLASSMKLEYPLNDVLPRIEHSRDRLLAKVYEFRNSHPDRGLATEEDYELLYAYALVTGQLAQDIAAVSSEIENLYGVLNEENLKLQ